MSLKLGSNDTAILAGSSVVKQMLLGSSPKFAAPLAYSHRGDRNTHRRYVFR